jgi:hypothetical protein
MPLHGKKELTIEECQLIEAVEVVSLFLLSGNCRVLTYQDFTATINKKPG